MLPDGESKRLGHKRRHKVNPEHAAPVAAPNAFTSLTDWAAVTRFYPALTTVNTPRDQIGHMIFRSLAADGGAREIVGRKFTITPELVVREATGPTPRSATSR